MHDKYLKTNIDPPNFNHDQLSDFKYILSNQHSK